MHPERTEKEKTICGATFYNIPKTCAFMGGLIHPETIKAKIRGKKLKALKLSREFWIKPEWALEYLRTLENTNKKK